MSQAILVTGGAGYVGSHCCKAIATAGFVPVAYDAMTTGHADLVAFGPLEKGDIRDRERLTAVFGTYEPVAVVHCAARSLVGESVRDPGPYYDVNVGGTLNLLERMIEFGCEALVFSSTAAVYGDASSEPITEDQPLVPESPYGRTKLACENMMDDFGRAAGVRSLRLRYFNAAGADADGSIGERHEPETHLVPIVLDTALGRREALTVYGGDYPTPDGTAIRDYVHVSDLADAHVDAIRHLLGGGPTEAVNLGSGRGASVLEILNAASATVGLPIPHVIGARRAGDPPVLVADAAKARSLFGWQAKRSTVEHIIGDAWRWHQRAFAKGE